MKTNFFYLPILIASVIISCSNPVNNNLPQTFSNITIQAESSFLLPHEN